MDDLNAAERAILAEIDGGNAFIIGSLLEIIAASLAKKGVCYFVKIIDEPQEFGLPPVRFAVYQVTSRQPDDEPGA